MKRNIRTLRKLAATTAVWRGHSLTWTAVDDRDDRQTTIGTCRYCGADVACNTRPLPNEAEIGGSAVAVNCSMRGNRKDRKR